jgi:CheY-like chemotaxis protein
VSDATRVRQILVNLLSNAIKFTDAGDVTVTAASTTLPSGEIELRFAVVDTGIGIPADRVGQLFQSFTQVDASTTRKYGGTGLGLAISRRLTELLGGRIGVESTHGKGSRFWFTIRARAGQLQTLEAGRAPRTTAETLPLLTGKRVLFVDDHAASRQSLQRQAEVWGISASAASSGEEAIQLIAAGQRFDLVVVDLQMPGMDGVALASAIREILGSSAPPMIVLSSLGRRGQDRPGVFAASLTKPIKASRLYDTMMDVLAPVVPAATSAGPGAFGPRLAERHPLRILLAEDNIVNQKVALSMLERLGYRADLATNGVEAVAAVNRAPYDVVFMDLHMPELDGLGAMRQIAAAHPAGHRPRVVALTANAFDEDREDCLAAGMDDYLTKPLQRELLEAALLRVVRAV